jgi:hypothetical protein
VAEVREFALMDVATKRLTRFGAEDLERKLADVVVLLEKHAEKLKEVGGYTLDGFDVTIALKGNALVFSAEGGLKLSYKKKAQ